MFALMQISMAAGVFYTNDDVNFRSGPSIDSSVISTLISGSKIEVLEHGWSNVKYDGMEGFVRSDFLVISANGNSGFYVTTDTVNFRTGSSLESAVISTLHLATAVEVISHGWSQVSVNGSTGYVRSDFISSSASSSSSESQAADTTLKTNDGVNLRSGPSTEYSVLATLNANTNVRVLEHNPDGWSKVEHNGNTGYIRSDFLSVSGRSVELLEWSSVRNLIQYGTTIRVYDVGTGISFNIQCFSKGDHADVETLTKADSEAHLRTHGGVRTWNARPVWVTIADRTIAASLHGMPHDVSWVPDNDMDGHICLHFLGSTTSSTSASYKANLQNAVQEAWDAR